MLKKFFLILFLFPVVSLSAAFMVVDGNFYDAKYAPTLSASEHFQTAAMALDNEEWDEALRHFRIITIHFVDTPYYAESLFYSVVSYYFTGEYDLANEMISAYLAA